MNEEIRELEPKEIWNNFADLNAIPRPSKKEEKVTAFMKKFGEDLGLETIVDAVGNVIIKKPASKGMEGKPAIILQSHLDMVAQKNADTDFDFETQGIEMYVDGDWVKAKGTTLGADNGIGVSTIMALLQSTDLAHPPLEALFTIDEETGMTGAMALQPNILEGTVLLNLDSEDDTEITIGCAGGIDVNISDKYKPKKVKGDFQGYQLTVKGLKGGHSGMDIHLGRGNANKILTRLIWMAQRKFGLRLSAFDGGGLRNAIPREAHAVVAVKKEKAADFEAFIEAITKDLHNEYHTTDPNMVVELEQKDAPNNLLSRRKAKKIVNALYACQNGIYRMSPDVEGLVQSSNNLARVLVTDGKIEVQCLTRGSVDSEKMDLAQTLKAAFQLAGAKVEFKGSYPGWMPIPDAPINAIVEKSYRKIMGQEPHITACHAGLECGILKNPYPNVDMISFGPNIRGAHSPDERTQISSIQKFWVLVKEILAEF